MKVISDIVRSVYWILKKIHVIFFIKLTFATAFNSIVPMDNMLWDDFFLLWVLS